MAARQHGVVTRAQLESGGFGRGAISSWVKHGSLHRVHRGVYAVGHPALSPEGRWLAAVLACGDEAALSHLSAAALWGLLDPRPGPVDVGIPGDSGRRRRRGIRIHRLVTLEPSERTRRRGIPVTTPSRTIADLRRVASSAACRRAVRQAAVLGLATTPDPATPTRSELEHRFLALCRRHRIALPEVNVTIHGLEVDFLWRDEGLVVETDGYRYHRGRAAFEDDRRRELILRSQGYDVVRFSYRQVTGEGRAVAAAVRAALQQP